jgi:hypothetical protein
MATLTERLRSIAQVLDPESETDPKGRLAAIEDAHRAMVDLEADLARSRAVTMREYVKTVGSAGKAARELGLSRARIYQIMGKLEQDS